MRGRDISVTNHGPFVACLVNVYTPGPPRPQTPYAETRHEPPLPSLYNPLTGVGTISTPAHPPSTSSDFRPPPRPPSASSSSSVLAHPRPSMSAAAVPVRPPHFLRSDPAFDMRTTSGVTLPPIRTSRSRRPSMELPSMKAILAAASSHFFSTDRGHHHHHHTSSALYEGGRTSASATSSSSALRTSSTASRYEKESPAHHPPPVREYYFSSLVFRTPCTQ